MTCSCWPGPKFCKQTYHTARFVQIGQRAQVYATPPPTRRAKSSRSVLAGYSLCLRWRLSLSMLQHNCPRRVQRIPLLASQPTVNHLNTRLPPPHSLRSSWPRAPWRSAEHGGATHCLLAKGVAMNESTRGDSLCTIRSRTSAQG